MADHRASGTVVRSTQQTAQPWHDDVIVVEEPLEIRVDDQPFVVTMRTPGADRELAAGFLYTEGIVDGRDDLTAVDHLGGPGGHNTVSVRLAAGVQAHWAALKRAQREVVVTSACGLCGKSRLDQVEVATTVPIVPCDVPETALRGLPSRLNARQPLFAQTGGIHGAALIDTEGQIGTVHEDIGRHNAVDKVIGQQVWADAVPIHDRFLVVSGRAGFEIVQKARVAGIPAVLALGAASSLAVELAERSGMRLYGFVRDDRWTRYA